ncbi:MAG: response regulator [Candidatus Lokiarchaeota archaeon]|nr:response regulator [Candidatus Lokiarchaeota archaeon]
MTKKKVLIVDDSSFSRAMLKKIVNSTDFCEVIGEASNGEEAVEKFNNLKPDLVTMDIIMPVKGGIEAIKDILQIDKKAIIIIVSTINEETLGQEMPKEVKGFVRKPFKSDGVIEVLQQVVKS